MHQPVVLIDLQHQQPKVQELQQLLEHYAVVYLFHPKGCSPFELDVLTDLAQLIYAQDVVILEHAATGQYQYDYALVAGQLVALLPSQTEVHLISAEPHAEILIEMLSLVGMQVELIAVKPTTATHRLTSVIYQFQTHFEQLQQKMLSHIPESLRLQFAQLNPAIQKVTQHYQSKMQKAYIKLKHQQIDALVKQMNQKGFLQQKITTFIDVIERENTQSSSDVKVLGDSNNTIRSQKCHSIAEQLEIDPLQLEVVKQLHVLKKSKPQNIYALRDFLAQSFPESDTHRLLKELIEKGYIHCEGIHVRYSYEMYVH